MADILKRRMCTEDGLVQNVGRRREDAARSDESVAGGRRCGDGIQKRAGGLGDVTDVAQDWSNGAGTGRVGNGAGEIRDQVSGFTDVTEADRLAEICHAVQRSIERRDLMTRLFQLRVGREDDLIGRTGQRVGKKRSTAVTGARIDGTLDEGRDRAEACELTGRECRGG
ncbi:hypothetical protein ACLBX9_14500 [Methylobacterium sp. A49B]